MTTFNRVLLALLATVLVLTGCAALETKNGTPPKWNHLFGKY